MKGVVKIDKKRYRAQYWNRDLGTNVHIGVYSTPEEASKARTIHLGKVYDGLVDDSKPKRVRKYPKGVYLRSGRYRATVQIYHSGRDSRKGYSFHLGMFNTVDEAVQARKDFLLKHL